VATMADIKEGYKAARHQVGRGASGHRQQWRRTRRGGKGKDQQRTPVYQGMPFDMVARDGLIHLESDAVTSQPAPIQQRTSREHLGEHPVRKGSQRSVEASAPSAGWDKESQKSVEASAPPAGWDESSVSDSVVQQPVLLDNPRHPVSDYVVQQPVLLDNPGYPSGGAAVTGAVLPDPTHSTPVWEFETQQGFRPYDADCQQYIEKRYQEFLRKEGRARVPVKTRGLTVSVDFERLTQLNSDSHNTRQIRRV